jgi:hypothetical protein
MKKRLKLQKKFVIHTNVCDPDPDPPKPNEY